MTRSFWIGTISYFFIFLFLYTAVSKLMEFYTAVDQLSLSPLLAPIAETVAIAVPVLEIGTSILLFIPRTRRIGLKLSCGLMSAFTMYIIYILQYNENLPCTCGGVLQQMTWTQHLVFNVACIIISIVGTVLSINKNQLLISTERQLS